MTAAVVGVIANLTLWFALHVLFRQVAPGPLGVAWPDISSFDWKAGLLAVLAAVLLFRAKLSVIKTLGLSCFAGLALGFA